MSTPKPPPPHTGPAALGRQPWRSTPLELEPDERTEEAVHRVLAHLLEVIRENAPGVLEDRDPEFLHQLRVAARRARSVLVCLGRASATALAGELRWLGSSSNACRDLDVHLAKLHEEMMKPRACLEPLLRLLRRRRTAAWDEAAEAVRSKRFRRLVEDWQSLLTQGAEVGPDTLRPVRAVADERILEAHSRALRRADKLERKGTTRAAHRLRIGGKRLRYLLEVFRSLYPPELLEPCLQNLKRLQDVLGDLQDAVVQHARLTDLEGELAGNQAARAELAELLISLTERRRRFQAALTEPFEALVTSRDAYERLTGSRRAPEILRC